MNAPRLGWIEANQAMLSAELAWLRHRIEATADGASSDDAAPGGEFAAAVELAAAAMPAPAAMDIVCELFSLSRFERQLLLLCCGVELDARLAAACARFHRSEAQRHPTFDLALATLPDAHWSALTPSRPLRHWRLIEVEPGPRLVDSPLRVDERILHFVAGINLLDSRLRPLVSPHAAPPLISDAHDALAGRIAGRLAGDGARLIHLDGDDARGQLDVAAAVAARIGAALYVLRGDELPAASGETEQLQVLWEREARLLPALLVLQAGDMAQAPAIARFADALHAPLILAARDPPRLQRAFSTHTVDKPDHFEQKILWQRALGDGAGKLDGGLDGLAGQFRFSAHAIASIAAGIVGDGHDEAVGDALWRACRHSGRKGLDDLAERISPSADWDDLVLPPPQRDTLRQIAAQLRQRLRVYEDWGFARRSTRGLGVSALFCGESGTGKTLAAEVLAGELGLDLYRIDLSSVVSKYIGETEKNLRRVFDTAEDSGAILLFDEADALFGKRSEVKDSHDRYANIEVSYLLQRMEAYRGLAVLTTNMKAALDRAFQRRLRFILHFPFPDGELREAIWRRAFPPQVPLGEIDYRKLARLNLPGGNIRNIALNSAFLAADAGEVLGMSHLLRAAHSESAKLERPLAEVETRGWA
jgi:hypothetical protein